MRNIFLALTLLVACDVPLPGEGSSSSAGTTTTGTDGGSSGYQCPAPPLPPADAPNDHCACDLDNPQCGLGLDCVPWEGGGRCLAKCFGPNKDGGGYITTCTSGQLEIGCVNPYGAGPGGPYYCPACLTCDPVNPKSLVCG